MSSQRPAPVKTRITEMLGIDYPIIQAPMGWIARAQLASAVSNAGGLGIIETSSGELDAVREEIRKMRDLTDKPFGVNIVNDEIAFFPILSNTALGLASADHNLVDLFDLYRASRFKQLIYLRLPSALPYFLGGLRIGGGLALIGAIVAEIAARKASGPAEAIMSTGLRRLASLARDGARRAFVASESSGISRPTRPVEDLSGGRCRSTPPRSRHRQRAQRPATPGYRPNPPARSPPPRNHPLQREPQARTVWRPVRAG